MELGREDLARAAADATAAEMAANAGAAQAGAAAATLKTPEPVLSPALRASLRPGAYAASAAAALAGGAGAPFSPLPSAPTAALSAAKTEAAATPAAGALAPTTRADATGGSAASARLSHVRWEDINIDAPFSPVGGSGRVAAASPTAAAAAGGSPSLAGAAAAAMLPVLAAAASPTGAAPAPASADPLLSSLGALIAEGERAEPLALLERADALLPYLQQFLKEAATATATTLPAPTTGALGDSIALLAQLCGALVAAVNAHEGAAAAYAALQGDHATAVHERGLLNASLSRMMAECAAMSRLLADAMADAEAADAAKADAEARYRSLAAQFEAYRLQTGGAAAVALPSALMQAAADRDAAMAALQSHLAASAAAAGASVQAVEAAAYEAPQLDEAGAPDGAISIVDGEPQRQASAGLIDTVRLEAAVEAVYLAAEAAMARPQQAIEHEQQLEDAGAATPLPSPESDAASQPLATSQSLSATTDAAAIATNTAGVSSPAGSHVLFLSPSVRGSPAPTALPIADDASSASLRQATPGAAGAASGGDSLLSPSQRPPLARTVGAAASTPGAAAATPHLYAPASAGGVTVSSARTAVGGLFAAAGASPTALSTPRSAGSLMGASNSGSGAAAGPASITAALFSTTASSSAPSASERLVGAAIETLRDISSGALGRTLTGMGSTASLQHLAAAVASLGGSGGGSGGGSHHRSAASSVPGSAGGLNSTAGSAGIDLLGISSAVSRRSAPVLHLGGNGGTGADSSYVYRSGGGIIIGSAAGSERSGVGGSGGGYSGVRSAGSTGRTVLYDGALPAAPSFASPSPHNASSASLAGTLGLVAPMSATSSMEADGASAHPAATLTSALGSTVPSTSATSPYATVKRLVDMRAADGLASPVPPAAYAHLACSIDEHATAGLAGVSDGNASGSASPTIAATATITTAAAGVVSAGAIDAAVALPAFTDPTTPAAFAALTPTATAEPVAAFASPRAGGGFSSPTGRIVAGSAAAWASPSAAGGLGSPSGRGAATRRGSVSVFSPSRDRAFAPLLAELEVGVAAAVDAAAAAAAASTGSQEAAAIEPAAATDAVNRSAAAAGRAAAIRVVLGLPAAYRTRYGNSAAAATTLFKRRLSNADVIAAASADAPAADEDADGVGPLPSLSAAVVAGSRAAALPPAGRRGAATKAASFHVVPTAGLTADDILCGAGPVMAALRGTSTAAGGGGGGIRGVVSQPQLLLQGGRRGSRLSNAADMDAAFSAAVAGGAPPHVADSAEAAVRVRGFSFASEHHHPRERAGSTAAGSRSRSGSAAAAAPAEPVIAAAVAVSAPSDAAAAVAAPAPMTSAPSAVSVLSLTEYCDDGALLVRIDSAASMGLTAADVDVGPAHLPGSPPPAAVEAPPAAALTAAEAEDAAALAAPSNDENDAPAAEEAPPARTPAPKGYARRALAMSTSPSADAAVAVSAPVAGAQLPIVTARAGNYTSDELQFIVSSRSLTAPQHLCDCLDAHARSRRGGSSGQLTRARSGSGSGGSMLSLVAQGLVRLRSFGAASDVSGGAERQHCDGCDARLATTGPSHAHCSNCRGSFCVDCVGASPTSSSAPHASLHAAILVARHVSGYPGFTGAAVMLPPAAAETRGRKAPRLPDHTEVVRYCGGCASALAFTSPVRGAAVSQAHSMLPPSASPLRTPGGALAAAHSPRAGIPGAALYGGDIIDSIAASLGVVAMTSDDGAL